jgi:hypothetical protein
MAFRGGRGPGWLDGGGGGVFRGGRRGICVRIMRKRGAYSIHIRRKDEVNICRYM